MALPSLTPEQRQAALDKATAARRVRAGVKERLRDASATLEDVIAESRTDEAIAKLKVKDLLQSLPGIGEVRARDIMTRLKIAESRRLRGLGPHQVAALVSEFGRRG